MENSTTPGPEEKISANGSDEFIQVEDPNVEVASDNGAYNPLKDAVIEREYSKQVGATDPTPTVERVAPPSFQSPPPPPKNDGKGNASFMGDKNTQQSGNPNMQELPQKDKLQAAELLTSTILGAYKDVCKVAGKALTVSDEEIMDWVMKDKISLNLKIPYIRSSGDTAEITIREFYQSYNGQVLEAFEVSPEFFTDVRPVMIRVFAAKGWGMTDEQYLLQAFGKEIFGKGLAFIQLRRNLSAINQSLFGIWAEIKNKRDEVAPNYSNQGPDTTSQSNSSASQSEVSGSKVADKPGAEETGDEPEQVNSQQPDITTNVRKDSYVTSYEIPKSDASQMEPTPTIEELNNNVDAASKNSGNGDISEVEFIEEKP